MPAPKPRETPVTRAGKRPYTTRPPTSQRHYPKGGLNRSSRQALIAKLQQQLRFDLPYHYRYSLHPVTINGERSLLKWCSTKPIAMPKHGAHPHHRWSPRKSIFARVRNRSSTPVLLSMVSALNPRASWLAINPSTHSRGHGVIAYLAPASISEALPHISFFDRENRISSRRPCSTYSSQGMRHPAPELTYGNLGCFDELMPKNTRNSDR